MADSRSHLVGCSEATSADNGATSETSSRDSSKGHGSRSASSPDRAPSTPPLVSHEGVAERFHRLGINERICKQIVATHPHIRAPTVAQSALIPAILSHADLIFRAHTGTGKSFGILLALLAKPRIVFRDLDGTSGGRLEKSKGKAKEPEPKRRAETGIASIIVVPSNELAAQYMAWARRLFPKSVLPSLDPVIQCLVRGGDNGLTPEEEQAKLRRTPPHILIGTPGRIKDILDTPAGLSLLGIDTLRTLVLDEADAILQLPGRFPGQKQRWKHQVHKAPGLELLNTIMKRRPTYSGGERHLTAGLENRPGKRKDERRPPEHIRRQVYKAAENPDTGLALPRPRPAGAQPLQLVCASATANSVMRHFFGARTGWLRTGAKESETRIGGGSARSTATSGRWIDLTGLSGSSMADEGIRSLLRDTSATSADFESLIDARPASLPAGIEHTCVVVDEAPLSRRLSRFPLRNLEPKLAKRRPDKDFLDDGRDGPASPAAAEIEPEMDEDRFGWNAADGEELKVVKPPSDPAEHEVDEKLVEALAFCFASEGVSRGLALIPPRWSLFKTRAALESLGLSVRLASAGQDGQQHAAEATGREAAGGEEEEPHLYLLQSTSARGLDLPGLSHVFLLGYHAVIDAVQYTHMAGRVARIGAIHPPSSPSSSAGQDDGSMDAQRQRGKVVTLLRGIPHDYVEDPSLIAPTPRSSRSRKAEGKGVSDLEAAQGGRTKKREERWISIWEQKMGAVFRRLGVVPRKLDLTLLDGEKRKVVLDQDAPAAIQADMAEAEEEEREASVQKGEEDEDEVVVDADEAVEVAGQEEAVEAVRQGVETVDDEGIEAKREEQVEVEVEAEQPHPVEEEAENKGEADSNSNSDGDGNDVLDDGGKSASST
ncbi:related to RRP3 - protein involved in rRNA processing [Pseudozyma flocculosa]|uniref:RNA helicase n=1 Tax=Pseudozyma flocculosa TaxID=84751 RepID=A0A5C3F375_9BASI|nr:related to RRP3 - protein involved in rRNA processing [Pseudozyma flocculosa]